MHAVPMTVCSLGHYTGNSVGMGEWQWKDIGKFYPFKKQITLFQAKIMCGLGFVFGDIVNTPMYVITGDRLVVVETSNVSRCSIKKWIR